jgi:hypothetical protein
MKKKNKNVGSTEEKILFCAFALFSIVCYHFLPMSEKSAMWQTIAFLYN